MRRLITPRRGVVTPHWPIAERFKAMGDDGEFDIDIANGDDDGEFIVNEDGTFQICTDCCGVVCFPDCEQTPTNDPVATRNGGACSGGLKLDGTYSLNKSQANSCPTVPVWMWELEISPGFNSVLTIWCCCDDNKIFARILPDFTTDGYGGSDSSICSSIPANVKDVTAEVSCDSASGNLTGTFNLVGLGGCSGGGRSMDVTL